MLAIVRRIGLANGELPVRRAHAHKHYEICDVINLAAGRMFGGSVSGGFRPGDARPHRYCVELWLKSWLWYNKGGGGIAHQLQ